MYGIVETGGKQYRAEVGETLQVELLGEETGAAVEFDKVLLVGEGKDVNIGAPYVEGSKVEATVQSQGRRRKIDVIKFKRRKNYHRKHGHRQAYTEIRVTGITAGS